MPDASPASTANAACDPPVMTPSIAFSCGGSKSSLDEYRIRPATRCEQRLGADAALVVDRVGHELAGDDDEALALAETRVAERTGEGRARGDRRHPAGERDTWHHGLWLVLGRVDRGAGERGVEPGERAVDGQRRDQCAVGGQQAAVRVLGGGIDVEPRLHGAARRRLWEVGAAQRMVDLEPTAGRTGLGARPERRMEVEVDRLQVGVRHRLRRWSRRWRHDRAVGPDLPHRQAVQHGAGECLLVVGAVEALADEVLLLGVAQRLADRHRPVELGRRTASSAAPAGRR